jgi:hypothetical protein
MITQERMALDAAEWPSPAKERHLRPVDQTPSAHPGSSPRKPSRLWRIALFFVGLSLIMLGWPLAVSGIASFIGVPLIIIGLALMQAQE